MENEVDKQLKEVEYGLINAMLGCCMLQFDRNLIRAIRKDLLDETLLKTTNEVTGIMEQWTKQTFNETEVPAFITFVMMKWGESIQDKVKTKFKEIIYELYATDEDIVTFVKKNKNFYNPNINQ